MATATEISNRRKEENKVVVSQLAKLGSIKSSNKKTVNGCTFVIQVAGDDPNSESKSKGIVDAVTTVTKAGKTVPNFTAYLSNDDGVLTVAFIGNAAGAAEVKMFLGPSTGKYVCKIKDSGKTIPGGLAVYGKDMNRQRGMADIAYDGTSRFFGNPKTKAHIETTVIHELAHILHEAASTSDFWDMKVNDSATVAKESGWMAAATNVSQYATKNALEFVAEVFTGRLIGKTYSDDVNDAYSNLGGP